MSEHHHSRSVHKMRTHYRATLSQQAASYSPVRQMQRQSLTKSVSPSAMIGGADTRVARTISQLQQHQHHASLRPSAAQQLDHQQHQQQQQVQDLALHDLSLDDIDDDLDTMYNRYANQHHRQVHSKSHHHQQPLQLGKIKQQQQNNKPFDLEQKRHSPSPVSRTHSIKLTHKSAKDGHSDHDHEDQRHATRPEEVYISDCCCVTRELQPAIAHMAAYRCVFSVFNTLMFLFGFANLGMGLWFRIDPKVYEIHKYIATQNFTIAGWILLFGGFLACVIALLGFVGPARQSTCLLVFYNIITITLTLSFVAALVLLTIYGLGEPLERHLNKEVYELLRRRQMNTDRNTVGSTDATQFLDFIQVKMRCCGAVSWLDYIQLGMQKPVTCYTIEANSVDAPGCGRAMRNLFDLRAGLATGFATGSILSQLATIILSALMFCSIYHWRAIARPATPARSMSPSIAVTRPASSASRGSVEQYPAQLYHQRPRSRTPIISS